MEKSQTFIIEELPSDLTPDRLPRSLFESPYFFLLESSLGGRYSIAAWDPLCVIKAREGEDFFETLRQAVKEFPAVEAPKLPFAGGWIGYLGYELYSHLEKKIPSRQPDLIPQAVFCFYDTFYLYDHLKSMGFAVSIFPSGVLPSRPVELAGIMQRFRSGPRLPDAKSLHLKERSDSPRPFGEDPLGGETWPRSNFPKSEYIEAIQKIKSYIAAGDCYQVNLSQRFSCHVKEDPYTLYQKLRRTSPSPYAAFLNLGEAQILSSSPESFLEVNGRQVITRPIKGTRPRGRNASDDEKLRVELESSAKDRAELLMITDLERNDLGRVCTPGSITVPELQRIESFPQVHHLVATIRGELSPDKEWVDLLKATFPGGSITGAPKIRAMQIIHELEPHPRNVYCGAIGFLSLNGKAQFNIAIRTMILKKNQATFWAGGGIVADSDPEAEYQETLAKARGMIETLDPDCWNDLGDGVRLKKLREEEPRNKPSEQKHVVDPDRMKPAQDHH